MIEVLILYIFAVGMAHLARLDKAALDLRGPWSGIDFRPPDHR